MMPPRAGNRIAEGRALPVPASGEISGVRLLTGCKFVRFALCLIGHNAN